jgi:hypothetical protein
MMKNAEYPQEEISSRFTPFNDIFIRLFFFQIPSKPSERTLMANSDNNVSTSLSQFLNKVNGHGSEQQKESA